MPFELAGFMARVGVEVAYDVILAVGAGEDRKAAITRSIVFPLLLLVLAFILWRVLTPALPDSAGALLFAIALVVLGAYLAERFVEEVTRLRHWGEPELIVSAIGLTMPPTTRPEAVAATIAAEQKEWEGRT